MKRLLRPTLGVALRMFAALFAPAFRWVAQTGIGSEACLRQGFLAVPLHYYQPIFDAESVPPEVWRRKHDLPGVKFAPQEQLAFLSSLGQFGNECLWPEQPTSVDRESTYYAQNRSFGYSSACLLHCIIRLKKPQRVIEVGAGMSTHILLGALDTNLREGDTPAGHLLTIDPYPLPAISALARHDFTVMPQAVQDIALETFTSLRKDDLLFIDSSHVVRTGGDLNFLYLDVLPRLAPGVVIHIHDIQLPYEYPKEYTSRRDQPRVFWTEQYLLQAFLAGSRDYKILLAGYFLQRDHPDEFERSFPHFLSGSHRPTSSFYMVRE